MSATTASALIPKRAAASSNVNSFDAIE